MNLSLSVIILILQDVLTPVADGYEVNDLHGLSLVRSILPFLATAHDVDRAQELHLEVRILQKQVVASVCNRDNLHEGGERLVAAVEVGAEDVSTSVVVAADVVQNILCIRISSELDLAVVVTGERYDSSGNILSNEVVLRIGATDDDDSVTFCGTSGVTSSELQDVLSTAHTLHDPRVLILRGLRVVSALQLVLTGVEVRSVHTIYGEYELECNVEVTEDRELTVSTVVNTLEEYMLANERVQQVILEVSVNQVSTVQSRRRHVQVNLSSVRLIVLSSVVLAVVLVPVTEVLTHDLSISEVQLASRNSQLYEEVAIVLTSQRTLANEVYPSSDSLRRHTLRLNRCTASLHQEILISIGEVPRKNVRTIEVAIILLRVLNSRNEGQVKHMVDTCLILSISLIVLLSLSLLQISLILCAVIYVTIDNDVLCALVCIVVRIGSIITISSGVVNAELCLELSLRQMQLSKDQVLNLCPSHLRIVIAAVQVNFVCKLNRNNTERTLLAQDDERQVTNAQHLIRLISNDSYANHGDTADSLLGSLLTLDGVTISVN